MLELTFEFPPNDSFRSQVSVLSLYGMRSFLLNDAITRPNVDKLLLIIEASFNLSPDVPEVSHLSDPAKSTRQIFDVYTNK